MGTELATGVTAIEKLWRKCWPSDLQSPDDHVKGIAVALTMLSETLDRKLSKRASDLYMAVLEDLTPSQVLRGFVRASLESRYFPTPSELLVHCGISSPSANDRSEALGALGTLIQAMRKHGSQLKPIQGKLLSTKDTDGLEIIDPQKYHYEPPTLPPVMPERVMRTLTALGFGEPAAGRMYVAGHPAITGPVNEFSRREAEKIEARWLEEYGKAAQ